LKSTDVRGDKNSAVFYECTTSRNVILLERKNSGFPAVDRGWMAKDDDDYYGAFDSFYRE